MALYPPRTNSLILLPPKTGSTWVRAAIRRSSVPSELLGPKDRNGHGELDLYGRSFHMIGTFVRHPASWHYSYWWYRSHGSSNWESKWPLDAQCASDNFPEYAKRACMFCPGYASAMLESYTGPATNPINFIGKQENLRADLTEFLHLCGESFDSSIFRKHPKENVSPKSKISDEELGNFFISEREAYSRYGYQKETSAIA